GAEDLGGGVGLSGVLSRSPRGGSRGAGRSGFPGGDRPEAAARGARAPADQERRLAVLPALEDVRAARLFADRVQPLAPDQLLESGIFRSSPQPGLDPRGLAFDRDLTVAGFDAEQPAPLGCEYHGSRVRLRRGAQRAVVMAARKGLP